jgi:ADP-ribosylglycohydrolase
MLLEGGDTDTNAAIVGGAFGALVGYKGLPSAYIDKILTFDLTKRDHTESKHLGHPRDEFLIPKHHLCKLLY